MAHTECERLIAEAFLVVLGREVSALELRDQLRGFRPAEVGGLVIRLLSAPEFRLLYDALRDDRETGRDLTAEERSLRALGSDAQFVGHAYRLLLGRPVDHDGGRHFESALAAGEKRTDVLRSLILSPEFERRLEDVAPQGGVLPRDTQLCELANPAKWDNPEWTALLRDLGLPDHKTSMHRKSYEFAQLVFGLERLGFLRDDASVISVGAGHERVLYWLANHVGDVVATDMYEGVWQAVQSQEGDEGVLMSPADYAPFPYRQDRLTFMKMDARHLGFASSTFDVAYSLSSIEHFGGLAGASEAVDEMARVLKPGGVLVLATEYVIAGPPHPETFLPDEIHRLIARPGLELLGPIDESVYRRYEYAAVDLYKNPHQTPHMVVRFDDTVFTTVMAFLEKQ
jgi:SAM-dependent methyltransferase